MRLPIFVLILLATSAAALADETYPLPAVGSQLTYRLVATVKVLDRSLTIITGQVYTYTVTAVRGPVMEATITPVAMIYGCAADNTTKDCSFAAKAAGATRDGDVVTVPVPGDIADRLAKQASLKTHYFLTEERAFPMPGPKNPDDPNDATFGSEPLFMLTNKLACDYQQFAGFFPLGNARQFTLPCHNIFTRTQSRAGSDQKSDEAVAIDFSYDGADQLKLPSGSRGTCRRFTLKNYPNRYRRTLPRTQPNSLVATKLGLGRKGAYHHRCQPDARHGRHDERADRLQAVSPAPSAVVEVAAKDGAVVHVRRHGNPRGARLIISHGNGFAIDGYAAFWSSFLRDFEIVLFDARNHGWNMVADPPATTTRIWRAISTVCATRPKPNSAASRPPVCSTRCRRRRRCWRRSRSAGGSTRWCCSTRRSTRWRATRCGRR